MPRDTQRRRFSWMKLLKARLLADHSVATQAQPTHPGETSGRPGTQSTTWRAESERSGDSVGRALKPAEVSKTFGENPVMPR